MKKYFALLILLFSTTASAEKVDILKILQDFTITNVAAGKCITPKDDELTAFLANYQMVYVSAVTELKKRDTSLTNEQVENMLGAEAQKLTQLVVKLVETEGCESSKVQELIKRFRMQAVWKPLE